MKLIFKIFALLSLGSLKLSAQNIDSAKNARPKIFELAFAKGLTADADPHYEFFLEDLGKLNITSGKLVLSDVSGIGKTATFLQKFPKGNFPFQIALGTEPADTSTFIAYGRIVFSNEPVVRWEYALKPGEKYRLPSDTSFVPCFPDEDYNAMIILGDSTSHAAFVQGKYNFPDSTIAKEFNNLSRKTFTYKFKGYKLIALNGEYLPCYSAYVGYDRHNKICRLLIDTRLFQIPRSSF